MRYRYLDDFRRGISVFVIFSYGIAVLGTPQCPPRYYIQDVIYHSHFIVLPLHSLSSQTMLTFSQPEQKRYSLQCVASGANKSLHI